MDEARSAYFAAAQRDPGQGRYEYDLSCIYFSQQRWQLGLELAQVRMLPCTTVCVMVSHRLGCQPPWAGKAA